MTWIVEFPNDWFLCGTVATGDRERATRFPTEDAAQAALAAARKFLRPAAIKAAKIVAEG